MTAARPSPAVRHFVDYFGELGPRWGLPADACRVHAFLYVVAQPAPDAAIGAALTLKPAALKEALTFLADYRMVEPATPSGWRTSGDPWDMLLRGLDERRRRELPQALATLTRCHREALAERSERHAAAGQIGKMLKLVEDLAALDAQAQRLPRALLRGVVGMSGRAARLLDRAFGSREGGGHEPSEDRER